MSGWAVWAKHRLEFHHYWNARDGMRHLKYLAKILETRSVFLWAKWGTDPAPGWGQQVPGNSPRREAAVGAFVAVPHDSWRRGRSNCTSSLSSAPHTTKPVNDLFAPTHLTLSPLCLWTDIWEKWGHVMGAQPRGDMVQGHAASRGWEHRAGAAWMLLWWQGALQFNCWTWQEQIYTSLMVVFEERNLW